MIDLLPTLDPDSDQPLYRQIATGLADQIEAGALPPGERLAPVRRVAEALGVNFNTVARAYRLLEDRRLVVMHRGRGTFVRAREGGRPEPNLADLVASFLRRTARLGFRPQEVRWEVTNAIRAWMQSGRPPSGG